MSNVLPAAVKLRPALQYQYCENIDINTKYHGKNQGLPTTSMMIVTLTLTHPSTNSATKYIIYGILAYKTRTGPSSRADLWKKKKKNDWLGRKWPTSNRCFGTAVTSRVAELMPSIGTLLRGDVVVLPCGGSRGRKGLFFVLVLLFCFVDLFLALPSVPLQQITIKL